MGDLCWDVSVSNLKASFVLSSASNGGEVIATIPGNKIIYNDDKFRIIILLILIAEQFAKKFVVCVTRKLEKKPPDVTI